MNMDAALQPINVIWWIRLFDGPLLEDASGNAVRRFRSQRVGALLAYLALHLGRPCPREELYEMLWPEEDIERTSNRLRVALASLRRQLEPPGVPFGTVIDVSDRRRIRLRAEAVWCDVAAFEKAWKAGRKEEAAHLAGGGTLLPGYYDVWILDARNRFDMLLEDLSETAPNVAKEAHESMVTAELPPPQPTHFESRLPLYLTRFFGRETEQKQLLELVSENRLVTLTGPGGIGKTRLAVETAKEMFRPCVFVPLADLPDPERVAEATLQALQISPQMQVDPVQQLIGALAIRDSPLLILDNAEHLISAVAALSMRLLEALPSLHLLITSRQRLELPGEVILPIVPLEPPPHPAMPERLVEFPAIALFLDRARAVRPDFAFNARQAGALVEICLRLEGMPLALELAAARVTSQSMAQIAEALANGLMDLKSRLRGISERHRSLRAAIQGSYDLLPGELQKFFAALSVFQGGWTVEAARIVTGCRKTDEYLEELVTHSLVVIREEEHTGVMRYSFLETLRQFAAEHLSSIEQAEYTKRHADYFLTLAASVKGDEGGEDMRRYLALDGEQENLIAALEWGQHTRNATFWYGLTGYLVHAWVRGNNRLAWKWVEESLAQIGTISDADIRYHLRSVALVFLPEVGRFEEAERVAQAMQADSEAQHHPAEAIFARTLLGYVANHRGAYEQAVRMEHESLQQARSLNNVFLLRTSLSLTTCALSDYGHFLGGENWEGRAALQEAESLCRELLALLSPYSRFLSTAQLMLATILDDQHKSLEGYAYLKQAQQTAVAHRKIPVIMQTSFLECVMAHRIGLFEHAALFFGAFVALQERIGFTHADMGYSIVGGAQQAQDLYEHLQNRLGLDTFDSLIRRGRQASFEDLVAERLPAELLTTYQNQNLPTRRR